MELPEELYPIKIREYDKMVECLKKNGVIRKVHFEKIQKEVSDELFAEVMALKLKENDE